MATKLHVSVFGFPLFKFAGVYFEGFKGGGREKLENIVFFAGV